MESWRTRKLKEQKCTILSTGLRSFKVRIENNDSPVLSCDFHKSGKFLVSSNTKGDIHIYPTDSATEKFALLEGHMREVTEVHYSGDGLDVFSGSADGTISIWDAFLGRRKTAILSHKARINSVQCKKSTTPIICSGSSDKAIRIWDIRERECGTIIDCDDEVLATCFSRCGNFIFAGYINGEILAWDLRKDDVVHELTGHSGAVTGLSLSPCGKYLASCSDDGTLRQWNVNPPADAQSEIQSFSVGQDDSGHLRRCVWSRNGRLLSAGSGNSAVIFDARNGDRIYELGGHSGVVTSVAFHPEKVVLCSAGADNRLMLHYL